MQGIAQRAAKILGLDKESLDKRYQRDPGFAKFVNDSLDDELMMRRLEANPDQGLEFLTEIARRLRSPLPPPGPTALQRIRSKARR